jgi:ribosome-binding protein aMBF1 (putative translation factor)
MVLMRHNCESCGEPIKKIGGLRRVKIGKQVMRMCKSCRKKTLENVLKEKKTKYYHV